MARKRRPLDPERRRHLVEARAALARLHCRVPTDDPHVREG